MFTAANVSKKNTKKKWIRVSGYRFRYQLTCHSVPAFSWISWGNVLHLFGAIDPKTANMSQFLQLGPLDFDPDLGYVSYFWGIDSANNHSHISKPHPLNNTDTLGGRFPWPVIQPLVNANGFWNAPQSSCPPTGIIYDALFRKELGPLFSPPFCSQCSLDLSPIGVWK